MPEKERLFLKIDEAVEAIRADFAQYDSQFNLLSVIWPMVFGDETYIMRNAGNPTVWAKISGRTKLISSSEDDLKQRIVDQLKRLPPDPQHLAGICAHVFGAPATAGSGPEPDLLPGIWVDTDMADFVCTQCGRCCRTLNYHDGCSLRDYQRWLDLGRTDILDWVGIIKQDGQVTACRIWVLPGTNDFAETCPWLTMSPDPNRYVCAIHDVRPTICRQYPGSRKHARMTGCGGV
ncbi:YkgJ family cysteine cluster protein [uncultured Desulfosarcina sp.]|uniref:YkgJ family cysteine cluster protein n=1 Tax=uncultured Desulfosarcina sp. TaxID=218289 RepID=UPI0029C88E52|nr:YkgJ family cysteine cluster protein [uncultured Desulfosarcina sp.]